MRRQSLESVVTEETEIIDMTPDGPWRKSSVPLETRTAPSEKPAGRTAKILIVDDDPDLRVALKLRLRANHYDTVNAVDGYTAVAQASKERPDLIILDLGLPAGDGFVVLDRLQRNPELADIPVIVLTARDAQAAQNDSFNAGACAFFQKPADNSELLQTIHAMLSHHSGGMLA